MTRSNRSLETLSGIAGILLAALDARGQSGLDASGSRPLVPRDGFVPVVEIPGECVSPDEPPRLDKGFAEDRLPAGLSPDPYALGFAAGAFRPPRGTKLDPRMAVRQSVRSGDAAAEDVTFGYVMFEGRITGERKAEVSALGADLLFYHPNNCFAARIPVGAIHALSLLPSVHWVGYARPEQKVHPNLLRGIEEGWLHGAIPVWVNLFQSDLGPRSREDPGTTSRGHVSGRHRARGGSRRRHVGVGDSRRRRRRHRALRRGDHRLSRGDPRLRGHRRHRVDHGPHREG